MAPLSVPVDTNPIVKEPPLFADGNSFPSNTIIQTLDLDAISGPGDKSLDYNVENGEVVFNNLVAIGGGVFDSEIFILDGLTSVIKDSYIAAADLQFIASVGNKIYGSNRQDPSEIVVANKSDGSTDSIIDLSGSIGGATTIRSVAIDSGNLYVITNTGFAYKFVGISDILNTSIDYETAFGSEVLAFTFLDGNPVLITADENLRVLDGFSTTVLKTVDLTSITSANVFDCFNYEGDIVINEDNGDDANRLQSVDDGISFIGNSGKNLEENKVYSFKIAGPNSTTTPTINDDGQGAKLIVLPDGGSVPVGALTGNFDFLYDGSNYVVVSLTSELAEAIYGYEPGALDNLTATTDPTVNDDSDDGYAPRSRWFNTSSSEAFMCLDATVGAAVWVKTSLTLDELGSAAVEDAANAATASTVALRDASGRAKFADPGAAQDAVTYGVLGSEYLGTLTASASATLESTAGWDSSKYSAILYVFENINPATDGVSFIVRLSTDGGITFDSSTAYDSASLGWTGTAVAGADGTATEYALPSGSNISNVGGEALAGYLLITAPAKSGQRAKFTSNCGYVTPTDGYSNALRAGHYFGANGPDAIQFSMDSGNIASGRIHIYGLRK